MAQINKPSEHFNTVTYSGNGSTQSITGVNFKPDWVWGKERTSTSSHFVFDAVRGATKNLHTNTTAAETTPSPDGGLTSFDSDGFSASSWGAINESGQTYVAWNWLANGAGSSNTDGSITSTVSANTTSGFSIVSWTNASDGTATCGHGLNSAPEIIITKKRSTTNDWYTYTTAIDGSYDYLALSTTSAKNNSTRAAPTSSVFTTDMGDTSTAIAYCFHSVKGYSKIGSYTGNGSADGTFVYTGFKPAWVMVKRTDTSDRHWIVLDNKRNTYNPMDKEVNPDRSDAEQTNIRFDAVSNGIKFRLGSNATNGSGGSYIYMCFAEQPLVGTNNIPATAR